MTFLILGVALWWAAHLFKRVAPDARARMGNGGRLAVTLALIVSVALMYFGYGAARAVAYPWWDRNPALVGINNLLMILAIYFYAADGAKTWLARKVRHPQLTGFKTWAVAHLLVNGDAPSLILFGGLLAWAVVEVIVINRAQPIWTPPEPRPASKEVVAVVITLVVTVVVMLIHNWLGVQPWG
ncbi:MAG: NnrU family protein [Cypionkella sp.]|jgi:uncharacterized membrane protein|nr:NnrU family protein [Cypionkella sp.]